MKTKFMIAGSTVHIFRMNEETALDKLPPKVYTVGFNQLEGFFLNITKDKLETPKKIYGKAFGRVDKCMKSYNERDMSTGILMTGHKGTGKSLLMSLLANEAIDQGLPVLLVSSPFAGSQFESFLESIGECCIIFDEFGKLYTDRDDTDGVPQTALLTLMDGVDKTKRLIIMTENRIHDINEFMINRPSRIYYHFKYNKMDEESIEGYCVDKGVASKIIADVLDVSRRSRVFSFDMLQSIVEEHLRFSGSIKDITEDLNINLSEDIQNQIEILKITNSSTNKEETIVGSNICPLPDKYNGGHINIRRNKKSEDNQDFEGLASVDAEDEEEAGRFRSIYFSSENLKYEKDGKLVYEKGKYVIVAKEVMSFSKDYWKMV